jgi:hypothetical protein
MRHIWHAFAVMLGLVVSFLPVAQGATIITLRVGAAEARCRV